jgi:RNA polymerase sigma factor for flagellar operon FliA
VGSSHDPDEATLLAEYAPIALWVASKYSSRQSLAAEWADVHADASIGVLDAIRRFDPARGATRRAYVFIRARGAAIDGIRQRRYTLPRVAGADRQQPVSLDMLRAAIDDGGDGWDPPAIEHGYAEVDAAVTVPYLLAVLSRRRRFVIEAYYLAGRSMADIGAELGVTESRVCQIHAQALRQMRAMSASAE